MFSSGIEEEVNGDKNTRLLSASRMFSTFSCIALPPGVEWQWCYSRQCIWISHVRVKSYTYIIMYTLWSLVFLRVFLLAATTMAHHTYNHHHRHIYVHMCIRLSTTARPEHVIWCIRVSWLKANGHILMKKSLDIILLSPTSRPFSTFVRNIFLNS